MATSLEPEPVFYSKRVQHAIPDRAFVPMQDPNEVDELVYSAPNASQPRICIALSNKHKPLLFPGYVARTSVNMLIDSGATMSFASSQWCAKHHVHYEDCTLHGHLANRTVFPIHGKLTAPIRFNCFKTVHDFLIADLPDLDIGLVLDFLSLYEPKLQWRNRIMTIADPRSGIVQQIFAIKDRPHPVVHSNLIQLCTMQEFVTACTTDCDDDELWLVQLSLTDSETSTVPELGKGSDHPQISAILKDFLDVLVPELPPGMPKERKAIDGSIIEHTIELDPASKPYAAQPRPLTVEEDTEIKRLLDELLTKGWIVPSLSSHAAPVVFVRKKPDPITG
jgi:hypothetical protein